MKGNIKTLGEINMNKAKRKLKPRIVYAFTGIGFASALLMVKGIADGDIYMALTGATISAGLAIWLTGEV